MSECDLRFVDLGEAIDSGCLAARWPELIVQTPHDLTTLLQLLEFVAQSAFLGYSGVLP